MFALRRRLQRGKASRFSKRVQKRKAKSILVRVFCVCNVVRVRFFVLFVCLFVLLLFVLLAVPASMRCFKRWQRPFVQSNRRQQELKLCIRDDCLKDYYVSIFIFCRTSKPQRSTEYKRNRTQNKNQQKSFVLTNYYYFARLRFTEVSSLAQTGLCVFSLSLSLSLSLSHTLSLSLSLTLFLIFDFV